MPGVPEPTNRIHWAGVVQGLRMIRSESVNLVKDQIAHRRATNAKSLAVFGTTIKQAASASYLRTIREGGPTTLFTVGYERRSVEDVLSCLRAAGVEVLADIRQKAVSRRVEFRGEALRTACLEAGLIYQAWPRLGSTESQRDDLHDSGDLQAFHKRFRAYARRYLMPEIRHLAVEARRQSIALLCYERVHETCHRSVVAELVADETGAGITAIV